jgi:ferredoxin
MNEERQSIKYIRFDAERCIRCASCLRCCPTRALRIRDQKFVQVIDRCIGCGECIRNCPAGAVSAVNDGMEDIGEGHVAVALVSPVLYAQFPTAMPKDILQGLRQMGFRHTIDMSYFLEIFHWAALEFIRRNRISREAPWPLISPVCPVVVRLIAFRFPNLLPNVIPVLRPMGLMSREVKQRILPEYAKRGEELILYFINPCPTKGEIVRDATAEMPVFRERTLGINEVYPRLLKQIGHIAESENISFSRTSYEYETCATGNPAMWGISGGEIADMDIDRSLAVSGLPETISYLEKIELGMFRDIRYFELRTCREGCVGGVLAAIDKYRAKRTVQKIMSKFGLGRRLSHDSIVRLYRKGLFQPDQEPSRLIQLYGTKREPLSLESLRKVYDLVERLQGKDCGACGAPDCRTFAEDVIRKEAALEDCPLMKT